MNSVSFRFETEMLSSPSIGAFMAGGRYIVWELRGGLWSRESQGLEMLVKDVCLDENAEGQNTEQERKVLEGVILRGSTMGSVKGKERAKEAKRWDKGEHRGSECPGIRGRNLRHGGQILSQWRVVNRSHVDVSFSEWEVRNRNWVWRTEEISYKG